MGVEKQKKILLYGSLEWISNNWNLFRDFAYYHRTIFEILFMIIYTVEQGILIFLVSTEKLNQTTVGYFALAVLFTFGLHKILMESRMKILEDQMALLKFEKDKVLQKSKNMKQTFENIFKAFNKIKKS